MWCDYCRQPVMGQKTTARSRNAISALAIPLTGGFSMLGMKMEGYACPNCGQPARPLSLGENPSAAPLPVDLRSKHASPPAATAAPVAARSERSPGRLEELKALADLLESGVLSAEEFEREKQRVLGSA